MGRYEHLKSKQRKKSGLKTFQKIVLWIVLSITVAGFIVQIVMQMKK